MLTEEMLTPKLRLMFHYRSMKSMSSVLESLELLRPFGMAFEKPVYMLEDLSATTVRKIGAAKNHMKLELTDGEHIT